MSLIYRWQKNKTVDQKKEAQLSKETGLPLVVIQLLMQRGLNDEDTIDKFLNPSVQSFHDPYLLHDMAKAVDRITTAIENNEKMIIYGDYDADGMTSTTIMKEAIESIGGQVDIFIPNRFKNGYGPSMVKYKEFVAAGYKLLITVDNGVTGFDEIKYAMDNGMDVVVTDHHGIPEKIPEAVAVVHPQYPGKEYPCPYLSGAGVAFKVASALLEEIPTDMLDLAAIGTVADVVNLVDENRAIVTFGLQQIQQGMRPGINALCKAANVDLRTFDEQGIGFQIAPRLNALGRMSDATVGVELLSTLDENRAQILAKKIDDLNTERKSKSAAIYKEAIIEAHKQINVGKKVLVIAGKDWHRGVIGIVAGNILRDTNCPTIVLGIDEHGDAVGSGRSPENFDLYQAMLKSKDLFEKFGGHKQACGLTIKQDKISKLSDELNSLDEAKKLDINSKPEAEYDLELSLDDVDMDLYKQITQLAPFGQSNPVPIIKLINFNNCQMGYLGKKSHDHLKLNLLGSGKKIESLGFGFGSYYPSVNQDDISAIYGTLNLNHFAGRTKLQFILADMDCDPSFNNIELGSTYYIDQRSLKSLRQDQIDPNVAYLFFHQKHLDKFQQNYSSANGVLINNDLPNFDKMVLLDRPRNLDEFNDFVQQTDMNGKLGLALQSKHPQYYSLLPNADTMRGTLKYLLTHRGLKVDDLQTVASYLGLSNNQIKLIIKVFSELNFVKIDSGFLKSPTPLPNHPLSDSTTYQKFYNFEEVNRYLIQPNFDDLVKYINKLKR